VTIPHGALGELCIIIQKLTNISIWKQRLSFLMAEMLIRIAFHINIHKQDSFESNEHNSRT